MKNFKFALVIFFTAFVFSSCEEDLGFLSDDPRDSFLGDWKVKEENTLKSTDYYYVTIENSESDSTAVLINNFYDIGDDYAIKAIISGDNLTIPSQTVLGFTIQGYGSISFSGKAIDLSYSVNSETGFADSATATYTKEN